MKQMSEKYAVPFVAFVTKMEMFSNKIIFYTIGANNDIFYLNVLCYYV